MENPNLTWMMTRGTPTSGNLHFQTYDFFYIIHQHSDKTNHFPSLAASKAPKNPRPSFQLTTGRGGEISTFVG